MECDLTTEFAVERRHDLGRGVDVRVPTCEVDHRAVVVDGHEIGPVRDLVGCEAQAQRRGLDGGAAGVVLGRVVPEDRHVADVAARRQPGWDHRCTPDRAPCCQGIEHRRLGHLERRAPSELGQRLVGTTVGDTHDVLHDRFIHSWHG